MGRLTACLRRRNSRKSRPITALWKSHASLVTRSSLPTPDITIMHRDHRNCVYRKITISRDANWDIFRQRAAQNRVITQD